MAFDGVFLNGLTAELNEWLTGGRVDKIHQPEPDALVLHIKTSRDKPMLYISANPSLPHITVIGEKLSNPDKPPMFCMLLRKHLSGARILAVRQHDLERILVFEMESRNELGDLTVKRLIVEIMGKHSNIILVDENDKIIDGIKRIPLSVSRVRQILPGLTYQLPQGDKLCLLSSTGQDMKDKFNELSGSLPVFKFLYTRYQGFSPSLARSLALQAGLATDSDAGTLSAAEKDALWLQLQRLQQSLHDAKAYPAVIQEVDSGKYVDLCSYPLVQYKDPQYEQVDMPDLVGCVNLYFSRKDKVNRMLQKTQNLRKFLQQRLDRTKKKLQNLQEDLLYAENAEELKVKGDLILSNLWQIEKGMNKVTVQNYFDPDGGEIDIHLDIRLTPSENAQRYFKRYNKLRTAQEEVAKQLNEAQEEEAYLEQVITSVELTDDPENIEEIRQELVEAGFMKKRYSKKKKRNEKKGYEPYRYRSTDGYEILVGKNNHQNDWLTLKHASKKDIWLHTKIIPGSHVIIRTQGTEPPEQTLTEAAMIAAWHSKARLSGQVPVDYTEVKHVSKPTGAKPGMVIYQTNQTMYVTPAEEDIQALRVE